MQILSDNLRLTTLEDIQQGALCIFGEIVKLSGRNPGLRPNLRLYVSMMRELAARGDYGMVKSLRKRMWPDSAGTVILEVQEEADHFLMKADFLGSNEKMTNKFL